LPIAHSEATEEDIDEYTSGRCHVFAAALHRRTGWPFFLVLDCGADHWGNEDEPIASVCHVFCVDPDGNAWDIKGTRPINEIREEMEDWLHIQEYGEEWMESESDLAHYVGTWGDENDNDEVLRPLVDYGEKCIKAADDALDRAFPSLSVSPVP